MSSLLEFVRQPGVDEFSGDGKFLWENREILFREPFTTREFFFLKMNFSIYIFCREANHQTARIRPRLGTEIFQVLDSQTGFFHYFTMNRLFQILASLYETSHETVEISLEIASVYQQDLIIFLNQNDDGCGKRRPDLFAAFCTFLTDVGCHFIGAPQTLQNWVFMSQ